MPKSTAEKVREALTDEPQTTAAIAKAAGVAASTAGKALSALADDGSAVRAPGAGYRRASLSERHADDTWSGTITHLDGTTSEYTTAKPDRKAPQPLRALVAEHLAAAVEPVSAYGVGKALGRSAGAVQNALDALTKAGSAEQTSAKPRAYRAR